VTVTVVVFWNVDFFVYLKFLLSFSLYHDASHELELTEKCGGGGVVACCKEISVRLFGEGVREPGELLCRHVF
jgi:hypothetical protein